jgi:hypothetical protein
MLPPPPEDSTAARPRQGYNEAHVWVEQDDKRYELPKRNRYSGFCWGYRGSGPNTLAWALLEDCFGSEDLPLPSRPSFTIGSTPWSLVLQEEGDTFCMSTSCAIALARIGARREISTGRRGHAETTAQTKPFIRNSSIA